MRILQISDTHNMHQRLEGLPAADVIVHCGDFTTDGTEDEVLEFLNWFIELPYRHKIFVTGNHDSCLWDAENIEELPEGIHFLQDRGCEIDGVRFFGLAYGHPAELIPDGTDVLVTHEPPAMILDKSGGIHWGNRLLRERVLAVRPRYHLFGHAHEAYGTEKHDGIIFSNAALADNSYRMVYGPKVFVLEVEFEVTHLER